MAKKPKILILSNDLKKGGIEKIILNSISFLNDNQYVTDLYILNNIIQYKSYDYSKFKIFFALKKRKINFFLLIFKINKFFNKLKTYNIVISHHDFSNYLNIISTFLFSKHKSIIVLHTYPKFYFYNQKNIIGYLKYKIHKYFQKIIYRFAHEIIVISNDLKNYVTKEIKKKSTLIYNPLIDSNRHINKNKNFINKKFVTIGTLTKRKNQISILKTFNDLNRSGFIKNNNLTLEIIGEGDEYSNLNNYIKKNNLKDFVKIKKNYENLEEIYSKSFCLISASILEGIPNVFIEALSYNLPIISSDIPAAFEILEKNIQDHINYSDFILVDYGIIYKNLVSKNLYNAIKYLVSNDDKYNQIKLNLENKPSKFTINNNIKYIELIDSISI